MNCIFSHVTNFVQTTPEGRQFSREQQNCGILLLHYRTIQPVWLFSSVPTQSSYFLAGVWPGMTTSLKGYFNSSSFLIKCFLLFFVMTCSTTISLPISFMYLLMNRGSQSSDAMPRSLQQRMRALDLQPSVAVGMPSGSKYCCSPRAIETSLVTTY